MAAKFNFLYFNNREAGVAQGHLHWWNLLNIYSFLREEVSSSVIHTIYRNVPVYLSFSVVGRAGGGCYFANFVFLIEYPPENMDMLC